MRALNPEDPARLGPFEILGILGTGGMGRVYFARDPQGRAVAMKVIRADLAGDPGFTARFRREVHAAARVDGRYTAAVVGANVEDEPLWLATQYIPGISLHEAVRAHNPLPVPSLLAIADGLAIALGAVHGAGLVHRDLKPSNVLLAADGPKVIDFGIAFATDATAMTTTGSLIGSPSYMAPEQITGNTPLTAATDIFALGGVLVFAATGSGAFGDGQDVTMLWRIVQEQAKLDSVPDPIRELAAWCLSKDPADRPTPAQVREWIARKGFVRRTEYLPAEVAEHIRRAGADIDIPVPWTPTATPRPLTGSGSAPVPRPLPPANPTPPPHNSPAGSGEMPTVLNRPDGPRAAEAVAPAGPARRGRRTAVLAGAGVLVVVAAIVAVLVWPRDSSSQTTASTPATTTASTTSATATTTASPTTAAGTSTTPATSSGSSPTPVAGAVPAKLIGSWTGTAKDSFAEYKITVTLAAGSTGQEVGKSSNTGALGGVTCSRTETLTGADADSVDLRAKLSGGPGECTDDGSTSTIRLQPDGSAEYTMAGPIGPITGTLHRQ